MNQFNWDQAFTLDFDLNNGLSKHADTTKRYLSQMKNMYQDQEAVEEILKHEDPLIYEFYELGCPERAGDLAFGTTMIHPGKIGNEYYMTKGHFHQIVDTAEVYYTLKGEGYMMLENLDGDWRVERMEKGKALFHGEFAGHGVDCVLTTRELDRLIRADHIDPKYSSYRCLISGFSCENLKWAVLSRKYRLDPRSDANSFPSWIGCPPPPTHPPGQAMTSTK